MSQVAGKRVQVRKAHSLIGQVYDPCNLARAWARVRENRGAGGVDRISIDRFEREHRRYLTVLHQRLAEGSYRPLPVRQVEIDKSIGIARPTMPPHRMAATGLADYSLPLLCALSAPSNPRSDGS